MSIDARVDTGCAHHRVYLELQLLHRINTPSSATLVLAL
jgi:hypothetical protein